MTYTQIQAGREAFNGLWKAEAIAENSFACESGMFLENDGNFIGKAARGADIVWVSATEKTYAATNETVAKEIVNYTPVEALDTRQMKVTGQTIVFDADLVTSNTINLNINGVAMTEVDFNTTTAQTITDLAAQILSDFGTVVDVATWSGDRTVLVTPKEANSTVVISDIVVAAGASQADAVVTELSIADSDRHNYYDITSEHYVDLNTESSSSGQVLLEDPTALLFRIVNA